VEKGGSCRLDLGDSGGPGSDGRGLNYWRELGGHFRGIMRGSGRGGKYGVDHRGGG